MDGGPFGDVLQTLRKQRRLSQQDLAIKLGVHRNTVSKWERGICLPESKGIVLELAHQLHLDMYDTRQLLEASLTTLAPYWLLPYPRNPFFTGREDLLHTLHNALTCERTALLSQAYTLSGLGGIGKTQTAIEYVYRYATSYTAVFWISSETRENILASLTAIADVLDLPEKQKREHQLVAVAVIRWLSNHRDWLLIFDNVEDPALVKEFLPPAHHGSLLFTSRRQTLGLTARTLEMERMTVEEGVRFLLHRAGLFNPTAPLDRHPPNDVAFAQKIVIAMDGLPLALDQAGAYIEETKCGLADYFHLFQAAPLHLLDEREAYTDHPLSVTKTFTLVFEQLERNNPLATELLIVCAFLASEDIPEMFFREGALYLGPALATLITDPLAFNSAIRALLASSLLLRHTGARTVTVHRLVQAILKGRLPETARGLCAARVLTAMSHLFPAGEMQADYWQICEQLLPHALVCITYCEQYGEDKTFCVRLMKNTAIYLLRRVRYTEAESLFQQALRAGKQSLSDEHPLMAETLNGLAALYLEQGKYEEAESLYRYVLRIREQTLGTEHLQMALTLQSLADILLRQGKYQEAERLYQRSLQIQERIPGPMNPAIANSLNNLGMVYKAQGKYTQAKPLFQRALQICEQAFGSEHPYVSYPLDSLAALYSQQGQYEEARPLYLRALHIRERTLGMEHPTVARTLTNLADLFRDRRQYEQAEPLYLRALSIQETVLGSAHPEVAASLQGLADLYFQQGKDEQAEALYLRALHVREQSLGSGHPEIVSLLIGLANIALNQENYQEAERLYQRALALCQSTTGPQHPHVAENLYGLAHLYEVQQRVAEALPLYQQALEIREQALGPHHPKTIATRTAYTHLLQEIGQMEELSDLHREARQVEEIRSPLHKAVHPSSTESDSLQGFLDACCERHPRAWCRSAELWQAYTQWVRNQQERYPLSRRAFIAQLKRRGCWADRTMTARIWRGIALVKNES